jgi:hypothetical protein
MLKSASCFFVALLCFGASLRAGDTNAAVSVSFKALAWSQQVSDLFYFENKKPVPLAIYSHVRSIPYQYAGDKTLQLFRKVQGEKDIEWKLAAQCDISSAGKKPLLILFPVGGEGENYNIIAIPDDNTAFGGGHFKIYNLMVDSVGLIMGSQKQLLNSGANILLNGEPTKVAGVDNIINFRVFVSNQGTADQVFSSLWLFDSKKRTLIFIARDPQTHRVEVNRIVDDIDPPEKPKTEKP